MLIILWDLVHLLFIIFFLYSLVTSRHVISSALFNQCGHICKSSQFSQNCLLWSLFLKFVVFERLLQICFFVLFYFVDTIFFSKIAFWQGITLVKELISEYSLPVIQAYMAYIQVLCREGKHAKLQNSGCRIIYINSVFRS